MRFKYSDRVLCFVKLIDEEVAMIYLIRDSASGACFTRKSSSSSENNDSGYSLVTANSFERVSYHYMFKVHGIISWNRYNIYIVDG